MFDSVLSMSQVLNTPGFWIYLLWNIRNFRFWNMKNFFGVSMFRNIRKASFLENIRNFSGVLVSWSIKNFLKGGFLLFFELGLKSAEFHFRKYKKSYLLRQYKNIFNVRARNFHFMKYKKFFLGGVDFFLLFELMLKRAPGTPNIYYSSLF